MGPKTRTAGSTYCQPFHFCVENLGQLPVAAAMASPSVKSPPATTVESAATAAMKSAATAAMKSTATSAVEATAIAAESAATPGKAVLVNLATASAAEASSATPTTTSAPITASAPVKTSAAPITATAPTTASPATAPIAATPVKSIEPRSSANKHAAVEPIRSVVAIWRASVRVIIVVSICANRCWAIVAFIYRPNSDANTNLRLGRCRCWKNANRSQ